MRSQSQEDRATVDQLEAGSRAPMRLSSDAAAAEINEEVIPAMETAKQRYSSFSVAQALVRNLKADEVRSDTLRVLSKVVDFSMLPKGLTSLIRSYCADLVAAQEPELTPIAEVAAPEAETIETALEAAPALEGEDLE